MVHESKTKKKKFEIQTENIECPICVDDKYSFETVTPNGEKQYMCYKCGMFSNDNFTNEQIIKENYPGIREEFKFFSPVTNTYWLPSSFKINRHGREFLILPVQDTEEGYSWSIIEQTGEDPSEEESTQQTRRFRRYDFMGLLESLGADFSDLKK